MKSIFAIVIVAWLAIGVLAAWQRGYFGNDQDISCKTTSDTALTILAGPLNYVDANPKVHCSISLPEPAS